MDAVLKPSRPRILPIKGAGAPTTMDPVLKSSPGGDPLVALLSEVPLSTFQCSDEEVEGE